MSLRAYSQRKLLGQVNAVEIAIRIAVEKSIEMLCDHFKAFYDIYLEKHSFIYDSSNAKKVSRSLAEANDLATC